MRHNAVVNKAGEIMKAGCVVVNEQQQILFLEDEPSQSLYLPKGHVEPGESLAETALRELQEETGYIGSILKQLPDLCYTNKKTGEPIRVTWFLSKLGDRVGEAENVIVWANRDDARSRLQPNAAALLDSIDI